MKIKLLLILSFILTNCYSTEINNFSTKITLYTKNKILLNVITEAIVLNKAAGNEIWDKYSNKANAYGKYLLENIDKLPKNYNHKMNNNAMIWLIHSINIQNKINYVPNRLFQSLFEILLKLKKYDNQDNIVRLFPEYTNEQDLEIVFQIMNVCLSKDNINSITSSEIISILYNKNCLKDKDKLFQDCIEKCKAKKSPGNYLLNSMCYAMNILYLLNLKQLQQESKSEVLAHEIDLLLNIINNKIKYNKLLD